jgi:hypothetical protein
MLCRTDFAEEVGQVVQVFQVAEEREIIAQSKGSGGYVVVSKAEVGRKSRNERDSERSLPLSVTIFLTALTTFQVQGRIHCSHASVPVMLYS